MKETLFLSVKTLLLYLVALAAIIGCFWVVRANFVSMDGFFAPKEEQIRRKTFEESNSYNKGFWQELRSMQMEYIKADPKQKQALASIILHRAAGYDENKLPQDLRDFLAELRRAQ